MERANRDCFHSSDVRTRIPSIGSDRRKRKRGMFTVPVQIRGGVGTLEVFVDLVTGLDVSRDGLLLSTTRGGYSVGQRLQVSCPYWNSPSAINVPRDAQVIRNVLLPNCTYALALQFLPGLYKEGPWALPGRHPSRIRCECCASYRIPLLRARGAKRWKRTVAMS